MCFSLTIQQKCGHETLTFAQCKASYAAFPPSSFECPKVNVANQGHIDCAPFDCPICAADKLENPPPPVEPIIQPDPNVPPPGMSRADWRELKRQEASLARRPVQIMPGWLEFLPKNLPGKLDEHEWEEWELIHTGRKSSWPLPPKSPSEPPPRSSYPRLSAPFGPVYSTNTVSPAELALKYGLSTSGEASHIVPSLEAAADASPLVPGAEGSAASTPAPTLDVGSLVAQNAEDDRDAHAGAAALPASSLIGQANNAATAMHGLSGLAFRCKNGSTTGLQHPSSAEGQQESEESGQESVESEEESVESEQESSDEGVVEPTRRTSTRIIKLTFKAKQARMEKWEKITAQRQKERRMKKMRVKREKMERMKREETEGARSGC